MSFSVETKIDIYDRAGRNSELSGETERPLECSHLSHDRGLEDYDTPEMAVLCTDIEHYAYHLIFRKNPSHIGLTVNQNDWSINELWKKVLKNSEALDWSYEQTVLEVRKARAMWFYYLSIEG